MPAVLICPGERPGVGFLAQAGPLVVLPILGKNLVSYWLEWLANSGHKQVTILATDRPEAVRAAVGDGSQWGLCIKVESELKELTPAEAGSRFQLQRETGGDPGADLVVTLDHLPEMQESPLFRSYRDWVGGVLAWIPRAAKLNRLGLKEIRPQVWCGLRPRIAPSAVLHGPCWLGDHVQVGADAVVGPNSVLDDRAIVETAAEIRHSVIGPDTFVGSLTRIEESIAFGSMLIEWRRGSCTQVPDPFLLSSLGKHASDLPERRWSFQTMWNALARPFSRLTALPARLRDE